MMYHGVGIQYKPPRRYRRLRSQFCHHRSVNNIHQVLVFVLLLLCCSRLVIIVTAIRTRITWINGIAYNIEHMKEEQLFISKYFGNEPIVFCHNPTAMVDDFDIKGYIADLTQAGQQKVLGRITTEVQDLITHLKSAVAAVGKNGYVIHIAHSQGALITYLAAMQSMNQNNNNNNNQNSNNNTNRNQQITNDSKTNSTNVTASISTTTINSNNNNILTKDEMERIEVIAFGGATAIRKTPSTPFKRCMNYYSVNDPLLYIVPEAAQALRTGFYVGNTGHDEFCFLAPRSGDPLADHSLTGLTYSQALQWEGIRYQQLYLHPVYRFTKSILFLLRIVFTVISERVRHVVKILVRPIIIWCFFVWNITIHIRDVIIKFSQQHIQVPFMLFVMVLQELWNRIWYGPSKERYVPLFKSNVSTSS